MLTLNEYKGRANPIVDQHVVFASNVGFTLRGKSQFIEVRSYQDGKSTVFNAYFNRCLTERNKKLVKRAISFLESETKEGFINTEATDMVIIEVPPVDDVKPLLNKMLLIRDRLKDVTSIRFAMGK